MDPEKDPADEFPPPAFYEEQAKALCHVFFNVSLLNDAVCTSICLAAQVFSKQAPLGTK